MLGISNSIFNEAGGLVKDWLKNPLNASFFYWYFLPALGLIILQAFLIWPLSGRPAPNIFAGGVSHASGFADLVLQIINSSLPQLILLPLVIAVMLSALAGMILRLYKAELPLLSQLFRPALIRNQKRSAALYGTLAIKRRAYLFLVSQGVRLKGVNGNEVAEPVPESERDQLLDQLKAEIQALHEKLEQAPSIPALPINLDRVGATDLANTLALAEEYPFERYSMDTAVFWPRLSAELDPEKSKTLTATFSALNGLLNLSLLSYLFAVECFVLGLRAESGWFEMARPLIRLRWVGLVVIVALFAGYAFYRAAVRAGRSVGNLLRTSFDYYRGDILKRFNLRMPKDIEEERVLWLKLGAFIRRGESFYYPSEYRAD